MIVIVVVNGEACLWCKKCDAKVALLSAAGSTPQEAAELADNHESEHYPPCPRTLSEACDEIMYDKYGTEDYPRGLNAGDVLMEIRKKFGPEVFPYCTVIDVADELQELYGSSR